MPQAVFNPTTQQLDFITALSSIAPSSAQYWVATTDATLTAERNLGLLTTGLVKNTVTLGVGVPSTAIDGTDYLSPVYISDTVYGAGWDGDTTHAASKNALYDKIQTILGTVTSVALSLPAEFTISGSPVTSNGTLTGTWASATQNYIFAAPNGSSGIPTFRAMVAADVPTLNQNTTGTATNATNIGITDDTTTNATMYPLWVTANTGNLPVKVTSTKLSFNPLTGVWNVPAISLNTDIGVAVGSNDYEMYGSKATLIFEMRNFSVAGADGASFGFIKGGGTATAITQTLSGSRLGTFNFGGYDNTATPVKRSYQAEMTVIAAEDFTTTGRGTYILWKTTNIGATAYTEKMRLSDLGQLIIGSGGALTNSSVSFELNATDKAFLPNKLTTTQRNALTAVAGMEIYNSTLNRKQWYDGALWQNCPIDSMEVTGTSQAIAEDNSYIANNGALVTLTLPTTCVVGKKLKVRGYGAGGWKIAQNASQIIHFLSTDTTTGVGGSVSSTNRYDCVELECVVTNNEFVVCSVVGNPAIV